MKSELNGESEVNGRLLDTVGFRSQVTSVEPMILINMINDK